MDLFAPPNKEELQKRRQERFDSCPHKWIDGTQAADREVKKITRLTREVSFLAFCEECGTMKKTTVYLGKDGKVASSVVALTYKGAPYAF